MLHAVSGRDTWLHDTAPRDSAFGQTRCENYGGRPLNADTERHSTWARQQQRHRRRHRSSTRCDDQHMGTYPANLVLLLLLGAGEGRGKERLEVGILRRVRGLVRDEEHRRASMVFSLLKAASSNWVVVMRWVPVAVSRITLLNCATTSPARARQTHMHHLTLVDLLAHSTRGRGPQHGASGTR